MRGQASENILTLMASIDRLHSQATNSELRQAPHQKKSGQTPTAVNEAAVADREVVHLNALFASPAHGQRQEQKSVSLRRRTANASTNSSDDFDAKLARLIEDVVGKDTAGEQPAFDNKEASPSHPRNDGRVDGQASTPKIDQKTSLIIPLQRLRLWNGKTCLSLPIKSRIRCRKCGRITRQVP